MSTQPTDLQRLGGALTQIDAATTEAGAAQTSIAARIQGFLDQIAANAGDAATVKSLADQATAEVGKLQPIADALQAMGSDPINPVPVPVPPAPPVSNQP